ncbi:MAG: DUF448 domain-containing protein [Streptosporangiales bacterium]|nr:DUF448 domain-containing protein [Streptosporangiales bacterium]
MSVLGRLVPDGRSHPQRTCVGCRVRAAKHDLFRVVVVGGVLTPDPRGRMPGRGAYLHPALVCLELAERRRAFSRALRVAEGPDTAWLRAVFEEREVRSAEREDATRDGSMK